jgi:hypothetical protein
MKAYRKLPLDAGQFRQIPIYLTPKKLTGKKPVKENLHAKLVPAHLHSHADFN